MIGVLGTVSVQSSSTFTSIIEAALGANLPIEVAIPMIMGANIGTSVTNTLVAMTQIGNKDEFERAFSAATVHDMFNWCTVLVLFTLELVAHPLQKMSKSIVDSAFDNSANSTTDFELKFISEVTDPFTDMIVRVG